MTYKMTVNEKIEHFESIGWKYLHDGKDWTSGVWYHDSIGCVNNGGGSFRWINQAIEALELFLDNLDKIKI